MKKAKCLWLHHHQQPEVLHWRRREESLTRKHQIHLRDRSVCDVEIPNTEAKTIRPFSRAVRVKGLLLMLLYFFPLGYSLNQKMKALEFSFLIISSLLNKNEANLRHFRSSETQRCHQQLRYNSYGSMEKEMFPSIMSSQERKQEG